MKNNRKKEPHKKNNCDNGKKYLNEVLSMIELEILKLAEYIFKKNRSIIDNDYQNIYLKIVSLIFQIIIISKLEYRDIIEVRESSLIKYPIERFKHHRNKLWNEKQISNSTSLFSKESTNNFEEHFSDEILNSIISNISNIIKSDEFKIEYIGFLFEEVFSKKLYIDNDIISIRDTEEKKYSGVFYTHTDIVKFIVDKTLLKYRNANIDEILGLKIVDPAMGSGYFLLEAIRYLSEILSTDNKISIKEAKKLIATKCIYGVDKNNLSADIARFCIWIEVGCKYNEIYSIYDKIKCGDSLLSIPYDELITDELCIYNKNELSNKEFRIIENYFKLEEIENYELNPFNWVIEFPDVFLDRNRKIKKDSGFDIILGNPPWGKMKININEFYRYNDKNSHSLQGRDLVEHIEKNMQKDNLNYNKKFIKAYSKVLNKIGLFNNQSCNIDGKSTGGDNDLYKLFLELSHIILKKEGSLGFVIPSSFCFAEGATGLRHLYLNNGSIQYLVNMDNKKKIFNIHSSYKFSILIYKKCEDKNKIENAVFNISNLEDLKKENFKYIPKIHYNEKTIKYCGGELCTIPEVDSQKELDLLIKTYSEHPRLGVNLDDKWNIRFTRELDMTKDSDQFITKEGLVDLYKGNDDLICEIYNEHMPLYEGRMVHQYDNSYRKYISGQGRTSKWDKLDYNDKYIHPHYYVSKSYINSKKILTNMPRASFCDITGQTNQRTVLATLIPSDCVCGNKVPTCRFDTKDIRLHLMWIGIANSFIVDWLIRKRMTTTLNFFHWYQIPFPRIDVNSTICKEIVFRVIKLVCINDKTQEVWEIVKNYYDDEIINKYREELDMLSRESVRLELECIVSKLFKLSLEDLALILYSFNNIDKSQPYLDGDKSYNYKNKPQSFVTRDMVLYEYSKYIGLSPHIDIVELYKRKDIDISKNTEIYRYLDDRINRYLELDAKPYNYID